MGGMLNLIVELQGRVEFNRVCKQKEPHEYDHWC